VRGGTTGIPVDASSEIGFPLIFPSALIGFAYPERNYIPITLYGDRGRAMYYAAIGSTTINGRQVGGRPAPRADTISAAKAARKRALAHAEDAIYHGNR